MADPSDVKNIPYAAEINAAAHQNGIRPALLAGLIQQESHFDPSLTSPVGARGLTQLMPDTARGLGVTDSFDPAQSINGGAKYLGQQLRHFKGDESLALAAYNAGPGNVEKYHGIPPFKETQDYVRIVSGNARAFENGTPVVAPNTAAPHTAGTPAVGAPNGQHSLHVGSEGPEVAALQRELGVTPDGRFGPITEGAVRKFQEEHALKVDGKVGHDTRAELEKIAHQQRPHTLEVGSHGAAVGALQRELGVTVDDKFGPKTDAAVRAFQTTHGLKSDGIVGHDTRAALEKMAHENAPVPPAHAPSPTHTAPHPAPPHAGTGHAPANGQTVAAAPTKDETAMQAFQKTWEANATVNARTHATTLPPLSATLDQKNNTLELQFRDNKGVVQTATMSVKETSSGRYDAAHILPGKYQLGNFDWNAHGAETQGNGLSHKDIAYGEADIPIVMRDGHDAVPVVLKDGQRVSNTHTDPKSDPRSDGTNERLHGGGSGLRAPFEPHQPLTGTHGCVRGENEDVAVVAGMIEKSGKPVPLTITRDTQSQKHEVQRSGDGGKTWQDVTNQSKIVGTLHDAKDSDVVSVITRGGNPPTTVSFKPEQLGFTKQQIEDIAARDPKGQISIGIDQYHQPVVNAVSDLARSGEVERAPVGAQR